MKAVKILLPKSDIIFKIFFGDERNIEILKSFLKAVLNLPEDDYNDIAILDPHLPREHPGDKLGILDVKLTSASGRIIHLEVQVLPIPAMENRIVYYQSKMITGQIGDGEDYGKIAQTISIVITDFDFIKGSHKYRQRFLYSDPDDGRVLTDVSLIYALDLTKLPKEYDGSALCDWMKFLAAETEEEFNMAAERNAEISKAVVRLKELSADEKTRMLYEAREKERRDNLARENGAWQNGWQKGQQDGWQKGQQDGWQKGQRDGWQKGQQNGWQKGRQEEKINLAKRLLLRNRPVDEIVEDTSLTRAEIEKLRNTI